MGKVISFEGKMDRKPGWCREKYGYNTYIDTETGVSITDPKICLALTKLDRLYDSYIDLAKKSAGIIEKYNIQ